MCKRQRLQTRETCESAGRRCWYANAAALIAAGSLIAACSAVPELAATGSFSGQVVVSGPLRGANVTVDQLDASDPAMGSLFHIADTTTDDQGRFSVDAGIRNGVLRITATGGSFVDSATGTTIQLDANDGLESFIFLDLLDTCDDALVSPIGHLIVARTRYKAAGEFHDARRPLDLAEPDAAKRLGRHFGNVDWTRQKLASLEVVAISPTEPVRAALVQAALSELAHDIAVASGASPQEVNVLTLTKQLAADVGQGTFDGNDHNSPDFTQGLQLGLCVPAAGCTVPPGSCAAGACRPLCDLYAGTPRALLAGELTKVIGSSLNQTKLDTADVLAVARAMADDADPDLFDDACLENLDRIPPKLEWVAPTPGAMAYVHGVVPIKVKAIDDTDPMPLVWIDDRTPTGSIAEAAIDTTAINGPLVVTATAKDMAGNLARLALPPVIADNLAPTLTLDRDGFFADGNTWWTTASTPTLAGTVADASPLTVTTTTQAGAVTSTVTGGSWTGGVAGTVDQGVDVTVTATDAASNHAQVTQRIHADVTPPLLTFQPSIVQDEALEVPAFDANEAPVHTHTGAPVDLAVGDRCPSVTKFSHLLGANLPPYGHEVDDHGALHRNPLHYVLVASDDGVGITAGSTQYRVGYRTGTGTTWIRDWTSAGPSTTIAVGVDQYDVGVFDDAMPELATTEGIYDVEFQATDRLGRTTKAARCFDLHLRAPPLHFQTPGQPGTDPDPIPVDHTYRLMSLGLGATAPFSAIAARLLNADASGASVIDEDVTNGTASTVYLEVAVTKPATVNVRQSFKLANVITTQTVNIDCTDFGDGPPTALCNGPTAGPTYSSADLGDQPISGLSFPVKVFELDGSLHPATEVPCLVCGNGDRWKFAIPPRSVDVSGPLPPRRFKVMTMISQVSLLWPSDGNFPATAPFVDTALNGQPFTGRISPRSDGCTSHNIHTLPDGTSLDTCTRVSHITPYRALTRVRLNTDQRVKSTYATAPTSASSPANATLPQAIQGFNWDSSAGTLP
jgi:hypothetical protein